MSISKIGSPSSIKYTVTFMVRETLIIPAKDINEAGFQARKYMMQRGGRDKCKLVSVLPPQPSS